MASERYQLARRIAFMKTIDDWLYEHFSDDSLIRRNINRLFVEYNWFIINPPGDGFCGVYISNIAKDISQLHRRGQISSTGIISQRILQCPTKSSFIEKIVSGILNYRAAYKQIQTDIITYNNIEDTRLTLENLKNRMPDPSRLFGYINNTTIFSLNIDSDFTGNRLNNDKRQLLNMLPKQGNIDILFFYFLAYYYKHNYIVLQYDSTSNARTFSEKLSYHAINFVEYYIDDTTNTIIFNNQILDVYKTNTSILFNDGHYIMFYNPNTMVMENLVSMFRTQGERLWLNNNVPSGYRRPSYLAGFIVSKTRQLKRKQRQRHTLRHGRRQRQTLRKGRRQLQTLRKGRSHGRRQGQSYKKNYKK